MAARELEQARAPLLGKVAARGVVEPRLQRDEPDLAAGKQRLERVEVEPVVVAGDADDVGAAVAQRADDGREARVLAGGDVARTEDRAAGQRQALGGAVGDQDVVGVLGSAALGRELGELGGELRQALDVGVLQRLSGLLAQDRLDRGAQLPRREQALRRIADRKRHEALAGRLPVHLGQHAVAVGLVGRRQGIALPCDRVADPGAGRSSRTADEGAAPDLRADDAELAQAPVRTDRGQMVDPGELGQLARWRQLLARGELPVGDRPRDQVDELLRERGRSLTLQVRQSIFV